MLPEEDMLENEEKELFFKILFLSFSKRLLLSTYPKLLEEKDGKEKIKELAKTFVENAKELDITEEEFFYLFDPSNLPEELLSAIKEEISK